MDNGGQDKRVIGLEPTTFTLATSSAPAANSRDDKDLAKPPHPPRGACAARSAEDPARPSGSTTVSGPDLTMIVAAWAELPVAIKAGIAAMVEAAKR